MVSLKRKIGLKKMQQGLHLTALTLLFFSQNGISKEALGPKPPPPLSKVKLEKKILGKSKTSPSANEEVIFDINSESGVEDSSHSTAEDSHRHSFQLHTKALSSRPWDLYGLEYIYAKNLSLFWLEAFISHTTTYFGTITENIPPSSSKSQNRKAESMNPRPQNAKEVVLMLGLGPSGRYKFPSSLNIFNINHLFHTTSTHITYLSLDETYMSNQYQGWGLRADYGLHKRLRRHSHLGLKFSYNFAIVKRGKESEDEPLNDGRFYLSWVSFILDYSYYF